MPEDFCVRYPILPPDVEKSAETAQVEMFESFGVSAVAGPSLAGIEEGCEDYCLVHFQLGGKAQPSPLPDVSTESPRGGTCFGDSVVDFCVNAYIA